MKKPKIPTVSVSELELIPVKHLQLNTYNPRKTISESDLEDLAESLRQRGQLQNLVVRPLEEQNGKGPRFEIVAGERRYRAAQLAGMKELFCRVVTLTDVEALEWCITENEHQADVSILDKAAGYRQAIDLHGRTAKEIAASIGKSPKYVSQLLGLLNVPTVAHRALEKGDLSPATAELIGRIPSPGLRERLAMQVLTGVGSGDPDPAELGGNFHVLTALQTKALIEREYLRSLKGAVFSQTDADLVSEAGSCKQCPKRAGNAAKVDHDTYGDLRGDTCLDVSCYCAKLAAHIQGAIDLARSQGAGIIEGVEAERFSYFGSRFVDLNDRATDLWDYLPVGQTVAQALDAARIGFNSVRTFLARPNGETLWLVPRQFATSALAPPLPEPKPLLPPPPPRPKPERIDSPPKPLLIDTVPDEPDPEPEFTRPSFEAALFAEERTFELIRGELRRRFSYFDVNDQGRDALVAVVRASLHWYIDALEEEEVEALAYERGIKYPEGMDSGSAGVVAVWSDWLETAPPAELLLVLFETLISYAAAATSETLATDTLLSLAGTNWQELVELGERLDGDGRPAASSPNADVPA